MGRANAVQSNLQRAIQKRRLSIVSNADRVELFFRWQWKRDSHVSFYVRYRSAIMFENRDAESGTRIEGARSLRQQAGGV